MINDANFVREMLVILRYRIASIANYRAECVKLGIYPNKDSIIKLQLYNILVHAYKNFRIYTNEQKHKINILYKKVSEL